MQNEQHATSRTRATWERITNVVALLFMVALVAVALAACQTADPAQHTPTVNVIYSMGAVEVWTDTAGAAQSEQRVDAEAALEVEATLEGEGVAEALGTAEALEAARAAAELLDE